MYVYRIYDQEERAYWTTPKGRTVWTTPAAAKNAWNAQNACAWPEDKQPVFSKQTNMICYEFCLVDIRPSRC